MEALLHRYTCFKSFLLSTYLVAAPAWFFSLCCPNGQLVNTVIKPHKGEGCISRRKPWWVVGLTIQPEHRTKTLNIFTTFSSTFPSNSNSDTTTIVAKVRGTTLSHPSTDPYQSLCETKHHKEKQPTNRATNSNLYWISMQKWDRFPKGSTSMPHPHSWYINSYISNTLKKVLYTLYNWHAATPKPNPFTRDITKVYCTRSQANLYSKTPFPLAASTVSMIRKFADVDEVVGAGEAMII